MRRHLFSYLLVAVLLSGCSSFKLGAFAYCPHGQSCEFKAAPPKGAIPATRQVPAHELVQATDDPKVTTIPPSPALSGSCLLTIPEQCSVWKTR